MSMSMGIHTYDGWASEPNIGYPYPYPPIPMNRMGMGMDCCTWVGMVGRCREATLT